MFATADICDEKGDEVHVVQGGLFHDYGEQPVFWGQIQTIKCYHDNSFVKKALQRNVHESEFPQVLVVDGEGSLERSLLGDNLAALAVRNGWKGVVVHGAIRDSREISQTKGLGVRALGLIPRKTEKKDVGEENVPLHFASSTFIPGEFLYADEDGMLVSKTVI